MITVNGRILENRYTTSQWNTANPILADRVQGYEVDADGLPIGMKMGNGTSHWVDLPYWYESNPIPPFIYNLPAGIQTPILINFTDNTIKIGTAAAIAIGTNLSNYQANPDINFEVITSGNNTAPKPSEPWITNKQWHDSSYSVLDVLTVQSDTDTGLPGGLTLDNINIIIKP